MPVPAAETGHDGLHADAQGVDIGPPVKVSQKFFINRHVTLVDFIVAAGAVNRAAIANKMLGCGHHFFFRQEIIQSRMSLQAEQYFF